MKCGARSEECRGRVGMGSCVGKAVCRQRPLEYQNLLPSSSSRMAWQNGGGGGCGKVARYTIYTYRHNIHADTLQTWLTSPASGLHTTVNGTGQSHSPTATRQKRCGVRTLQNGHSSRLWGSNGVAQPAVWWAGVVVVGGGGQERMALTVDHRHEQGFSTPIATITGTTTIAWTRPVHGSKGKQQTTHGQCFKGCAVWWAGGQKVPGVHVVRCGCRKAGEALQWCVV